MTDSVISELAVLRHNCMIDTAAILKRRQGNKQKNAALSNYTDGESAFDVCVNEIVLKEARASTMSATSQQGRFFGSTIFNCLPVLSSLNGYGVEGETNHDLHKRLRYAGVCVTQGKTNLDGGLAPDTFPADLQGLRTLFNNGRSMIHVGDFVMYDFPHNAKEAREKMVQVQGTPQGRVLPFLTPFNPREHSYSPHRMNMLRDKAASKINMNNPEFDPAIVQYRALHEVVVQLLALGGVIQKGMDASPNGAVSFDEQNVYGQTPAQLQKILSDFGVHIGRGATNTLFIPTVSRIADSILAYRPTTDRVPQGKDTSHQVIRTIIQNAMTTAAYAWKLMDWEIKSRVIGMALSTADVAQSFDIFLEQPRA